MVRAWFLDSEGNSGRHLSLDELKKETGVRYHQLNMKTFHSDGRIQQIQREEQFMYHDVIEIAPDKLANYEDRVRGFHTEHLHPEEEIRMVIDGSTYFDVRDSHDDWIRIKMSPGDLLILPPGIYHRLTLDEESPDVAIYRLFKTKPVWTSVNRSSSESVSSDNSEFNSHSFESESSDNSE